MAVANRAAIVPLIPKVLADLPAQREAAAHRDACSAFVRDYHMVGPLSGFLSVHADAASPPGLEAPRERDPDTLQSYASLAGAQTFCESSRKCKLSGLLN